MRGLTIVACSICLLAGCADDGGNGTSSGGSMSTSTTASSTGTDGMTSTSSGTSVGSASGTGTSGTSATGSSGGTGSTGGSTGAQGCAGDYPPDCYDQGPGECADATLPASCDNDQWTCPPGWDLGDYGEGCCWEPGC